MDKVPPGDFPAVIQRLKLRIDELRKDRQSILKELSQVDARIEELRMVLREIYGQTDIP